MFLITCNKFDSERLQNTAQSESSPPPHLQLDVTTVTFNMKTFSIVDGVND
jgi:hypothetical protein